MRDSPTRARYGLARILSKRGLCSRTEAARWIADEHWHSRQEGRYLQDGSYELKVPYSNPREVLMDVLRYGADARIIEPVSLRELAKSKLQLALAQYND